MKGARISEAQAFLKDVLGHIAAKEGKDGFASLTRDERVLLCVWTAEAAMAHRGIEGISPRAVRESLSSAFTAIGAPRKAAVLARLVANQTSTAAAQIDFGNADEDADRLMLRYWVSHVPGARADLCRRTSDLRRYFAWVAAWMASAVVAAFIIDWSFAGSGVLILVPFVVLAWGVLGVTVIVQAFRNGRWASIRRRLLLASAFPLAFFAQPLLMGLAIGPPSDISLMVEFKEHRAELDRLVSMFHEDKGVMRLCRDPAETDGVDPVRDFVPVDRLATYRHLLADLGLCSIERQNAPGWVEFTRWRGRAPWRVSEGFLSTEIAPADLVESVLDAPRERAQVFRHLEANWYLFRRVW